MHLYHTASSPTSTIRRPAGAVDPPARGPTRCHPTSTRSRSDNSRPPSEIGHLKNLICKMWLKMKIFMGFYVAFAYMLVMGNTTPNCGKQSGYVGIWWDMLKYWDDCYIRVVSEKVYAENDEPVNLRVSMGILFLMEPGHNSSLVTNIYQRHRELDGPNMAKRHRAAHNVRKGCVIRTRRSQEIAKDQGCSEETQRSRVPWGTRVRYWR